MVSDVLQRKDAKSFYGSSTNMPSAKKRRPTPNGKQNVRRLNETFKYTNGIIANGSPGASPRNRQQLSRPRSNYSKPKPKVPKNTISDYLTISPVNNQAIRKQRVAMVINPVVSSHSKENQPTDEPKIIQGVCVTQSNNFGEKNVAKRLFEPQETNLSSYTVDIDTPYLSTPTDTIPEIVTPLGDQTNTTLVGGNQRDDETNLENNLTKSRENDPLMPLALTNLGNTCYMNSMLQAVVTLPEFTNELETVFEDIRQSLPKDSFPMTRALVDFLREYELDRQNESGGDTDLIEKRLDCLKNCVGDKIEQFKSNFQQDAVEFLDTVTETIEDEFDSVKELISRVDNPITKNWQFEMVSTLQCTSCGHEMKLEELEKVRCLHLSIPETGEHSVQSLLDNYFEDILLEHKCQQPNCSGKEKRKAVAICKYPKVVFTQLCRYSKEGQKRHEDVVVDRNISVTTTADMMRKILLSPRKGSQIRNGLDSLDEIDDTLRMPQIRTYSPRSSPNNVNLKYNDPTLIESDSDKENSLHVTYSLVAVVRHQGSSLSGGHYTAYVFNQKNSSWYLCDDEVVSKVTIEDVQKRSISTGYSLLYVRQ